MSMFRRFSRKGPRSAKQLADDIELLHNSPMLDSVWYRETYADLRSKPVDCARHYLEFGASEWRNPHPQFDTKYYLEENPDVAASGVNPLVHYILYGEKEGRKSHPSFIVSGPPESSLSVSSAEPPSHNNHEDAEFFLNASSPGSLKDNNVSLGAQVARIRGLVDNEFYRRSYPDVVIANVDPALHYFTAGWYERRDPSSDFSTQGYLDASPDVRDSAICPLLHYVEAGRREGRYCGPPLLKHAAQADPERQRKLLFDAGLFDADFYLGNNPDVRDAGIDPFDHFMSHGWKEGRNPNPFFQLSFYRLANPDAPAHMNPLLHYAALGAEGSGRRTHPEFIDRLPLAFSPHSQTVPTKISVGIPASAPNVAALSVAVHLHCYYLDVLPVLTSALRTVPRIDALFITVSKSGPRIEKEIRSSLKLLNVGRVEVFVGPNKGRDIAPMLVGLGEKLSAFDIVLHLHTKKSVERDSFGSEWLADILRKILFNAAYVERLLRLFEAEPSLGIVAPSPHWRISPFMVWGKNKPNARRLLERLELRTNFVDNELTLFPASSMFWFRPAALKRLFGAGINWSDFESEPISDDGSLAHAIERCFSHIAECAGYKSLFIEPLTYEYCWPEVIGPKISVIIPAYNAVDWLPAALQSVMSQVSAAVPFEVIVVDNNSSDGTAAFVRSMQILYDNIVLVNEIVRGAGAARNAGLRVARGEFITFLDADDLLTANALQVLYDSAVAAKVNFVTSSLVMFEETNYGAAIPFRSSEQIIVLDKKNFADQEVLWKTMFADFGPCAKLYRRDWLLELNIVFPETGNFEDNAFIVDIYMSTDRVAMVSLPTYLYRRYKSRTGVTQSTNRNLTSLDDQLTVLENLIRKYNLQREDSIRRAMYLAILTKVKNELQRFSGNTSNSFAEIIARHRDLVKPLGWPSN